MARARNLKPALFKNELLGAADPLLTILFQSLWTLADREGRLEDRPLRIKAETFPYREGLDINGYLTELQRLDFILRYSVDGVALIQVINFKKHQTPHNTEKHSVLPCFDENKHNKQSIKSITVKTPLPDGENVEAKRPDSLLLTPSSLTPESLVLKPETKGKSKAIAPSAQFSLPDWIDKAHWDLWVKTRKKKMLPEQMQAQIDKLDEWRKKGLDHCGALANSALNGYTGLFLPDAPRKTGFLTAQQQRDENNRKSTEEFVNGNGSSALDVMKGRVIDHE